MEISGNSSAIQALSPRSQNLPIDNEVDQSQIQTPATSEAPSTAEPSNTEQQTAPRVEPQAEAAAPTTDLNELLLRNESAQQDREAQAPSQPQAENAQPQDRELQRNQLEDRFNALTNDAPSPNIDIST
ncbi:MAG: hypothetical protein ACRBBW_06110 [Cellvibrionaceae bacterium]